jgi:hypothetical protein
MYTFRLPRLLAKTWRTPNSEYSFSNPEISNVCYTLSGIAEKLAKASPTKANHQQERFALALISISKTIAKVVASDPTFNRQTGWLQGFDARHLYFTTSNSLTKGYKLLSQCAEARGQMEMVQTYTNQQKADIKALRGIFPTGTQFPAGFQFMD